LIRPAYARVKKLLCQRRCNLFSKRLRLSSSSFSSCEVRSARRPRRPRPSRAHFHFDRRLHREDRHRKNRAAATRRKAKKTPGSRRASRGRIIENHTHSVLNETFIPSSVSRLLSSKSRATLCDGRAFRSVRERGEVASVPRDASTTRRPTGFIDRWFF